MTKNNQNNQNRVVQYTNKGNRYFIGLLLIIIGCIYLLEQKLHTGWLLFTLLPFAGIVLVTSGVRNKKLSLIISGSLILSLGIGILYTFFAAIELEVIRQVGVGFLLLSFGWALSYFISLYYFNNKLRWTFIPTLEFIGLGSCLLFSQLTLLDFLLYLSISTGIIFFVAGLYKKNLGLIIPGALIFTHGPGVFLAWSEQVSPNALVQTGIMLVCFALGWVLITLGGKICLDKFIWWPLIPGGIMGMVGWGLYIGGNPDNAAGFIGNTGSIGLIIFGVYLLLMKKGIQQ